jgi:hypothetical protein
MRASALQPTQGRSSHWPVDDFSNIFQSHCPQRGPQDVPTIYSRGRALAKLAKGQYFSISVPAGTYYFSFNEKSELGKESWVTVIPGQRAFFKVRYTQIKPMGPDEALDDFKNLKPIEPENVRSPDVLTKGPQD